jgi:hypothetical protein
LPNIHDVPFILTRETEHLNCPSIRKIDRACSSKYGKEENACKDLAGKLDGKREHLDDLEVNGKILKWFLNKHDVRMWTAYIRSRTWTGGEVLRTVKCWEFLK